jgi:hypothetical protein
MYEHLMLPCIYKQLFGLSCPLCGFQRSVVLLLQGNVIGSLEMFPPLFLLLFMIAFYLISFLRKQKVNSKAEKILWIIVGISLIANAVYQNID